MSKKKMNYKNLDNLNQIINSSYDIQIDYFLRHISFLRYACSHVRREVLIRRDSISYDDLVKYNLFDDKHLIKSWVSKEEADKLFNAYFDNYYSVCKSFNVSEFSFDYFLKRKLRLYLNERYFLKILDIYNEMGHVKFPNKYDNDINRRSYQIGGKILFNEDILKSNSVSLLIKYFLTADRDLLIKILSNTYGEHVYKFFLERPNLDLCNIDNIRVFNKNIYDVLGEGFINFCLNSELKELNYLVTEFSYDFDLLNSFKNYFDFMTKDLDNLDINMISSLMIKFNTFKNILRDIDYSNLDDNLAYNIKLLSRDRDNFCISVSCLEDIKNYKDIRKKRCLEMMLYEYDYYGDLQDLVLCYLSGRNVCDVYEDQVDSLNLSKLVKVFNVSYILDNEDLINKIGLDSLDIQILKLFDCVSKDDNSKRIRSVIKDIIDVEIDFNKVNDIFYKIYNYCCLSIKNSILSKEKLDSFSKEELSGVEVVSFEGESYDLLCSVLGINLSTYRDGRNYKGKELLDDWLNRENGINTISSCLCSSNTNIYPVDIWDYITFNNNMVFVFDNDIEILGMGASDINSSHNMRNRKHGFGFIKTTAFIFSDIDFLKEEIKLNKESAKENSQFINEVTIKRRVEDIRSSKAGSRIMPIGLYVIGEITDSVLETAIVFNNYYKEHNLGKFRIIKVNPMMYEKDKFDEIIDFDSVKVLKK